MNTLDFNFVFLGQSVLKYQVPLDVYNTINHIYETKYPELKPANKQLVGKIEKEHSLFFDGQDGPKMTKHNHLTQDVLQWFHKKFTHYLQWNKVKEYEMHLNSVWINTMFEHEYNPVHHHTGLYSFVIWLKIPYNRSDEDNCPNVPEKGGKMNGCFHTFFIDQFGTICDIGIPLDASFENVCLMFPAEAKHCVYPFYTSDEYRISVSGNFTFRTKTK